MLEVAAHRLPRSLVEGYVLGNDVLRALYGLFRVFHVALDKLLRRHVGIMLLLYEYKPCERLKALLARHLGACASARLVWHVDVFYLRGVPRSIYALAQVIGELALRLYGFQDGLLALLQFLQLLIKVAHRRHLNLVEVSRGFLAVTADKRNCGSGVEKVYYRLGLFLPDVKALGDENGIFVHFFIIKCV